MSYYKLICFFYYVNSIVADPLKFIQLRSQKSGNFVTVYWPDGSMRVDSVPYTHASTFEVHVLSGNDKQWQLRAMKNNLFVSAEGGGGDICTATRASASGWETFNVQYVSESAVQLQSFSGNWLGIDGTNSSSLIATSTSPSFYETFDVIEVPQQRGVNLGSWFVPEKWMFSSESDLWSGVDADDLYTLCEALGPEEASARMNAHWNSWFVEEDFQKMANNGVNHIRIPMGYWDIVETPPYVFGGAAFIDKAIDWAVKYGMTVLVDLHGAPGSQNGNDHSGKSGAVEWSEPENVALSVEVLGMMAERWAKRDGVWGFELLNEPDWSLSHDLLTTFYRDSYAAIRQYSDDTHVMINSLYGPHDWTAQVFPEPEYRNAVLDLHLYTVWSGLSTPDEYYEAARQWGDDIRALTPYYPIVIGEMSLATALDPYTADQRQIFTDTEMTSFEENALGFIFWSDKLEYDSEDWSFVGGYSYLKNYYSL